MAWSPDTYNKFKEERFLPFYDLLHLINVRSGIKVIDLGCGTGELTKKLSEKLPGAEVLGIDSSTEMLKDSKGLENAQLKFERRSIEEEVNPGRKWDLVFSNAALQWVEGHEKLLPDIIRSINPDGQLVVQMPAQHHNISNRILNSLADEAPYNVAFKNWTRLSPVLDMEVYAKILFDAGGRNITAYEKIYPLVLPDVNALYDWVSGTALIPYLEKLEGKLKQSFSEEYKVRLLHNFSSLPVFYPFKRIIFGADF
jgi:trans-aconitate 2-methyltransferase